HLRDVFLRRRERGTTIFFSSHELAEVTAMCDRVLLVNKGRLLEERDLRELTDSLRQYWVRFRGAAAPERVYPFPVEFGPAGAATARFVARDAHLTGLHWLQKS